jgi:hypothetical protein
MEVSWFISSLVSIKVRVAVGVFANRAVIGLDSLHLLLFGYSIVSDRIYSDTNFVQIEFDLCICLHHKCNVFSLIG